MIRSICLWEGSRKTNITKRTTTPPPSPGSGPMRRTANKVLTRIAAAPPAKGAIIAAFLHVLPSLRANRRRPTSTAPPTPKVGVHVQGTRAPWEAQVILVTTPTSLGPASPLLPTSQRPRHATVPALWTADSPGHQWTLTLTTANTTTAPWVLAGWNHPCRKCVRVTSGFQQYVAA